MTRKIMVAMVAVMCAALALGALGCGNSSSKGDPEKVVNDFWSAMQKGDFAQAKTYLSKDIADTALADFSDSSDAMTAAMIDAVMGMITLKTTGSSINGDNATVSVKITMPDMDVVGEEIGTALFASMGDDLANMTEEQIMEQFVKELPKIIKDAPTTTEDSEVPLVWESDAWKIDSSPFEDLEGL